MKKLLFNKHNLVLLSIIIYFSFLNILFTKEIFEVNSSFAYRFFVCTTNIGFSLIFIAFISINRWLLIALLIPMLFIGSLLSYFKLYLGINFNEALIESTLNTHFDEILSIINFRLIAWIILFSAIPLFFLIKNLHHLKIQFLQKIKINIICGLLGAAIFYTPTIFMKKINPVIFLKTNVVNLYPANFFVPWSNYYRHYKIRNSEKKINAFLEHKFNFNDDDIKVVLVLGESARSDRFSINGYGRNTTPQLEQKKHLISFKDAYSLETYTIGALNSIFKLHPNKNENTLISIFKDLGFQTDWVTLQSFRSAINNIASEANNVVTKEMILQNSNSILRDDDVIPFLKKLLKKNSANNSFIILHTHGSHYTYDDRYTEDFKKFNPTCTDVNNASIFKRIFQRNFCEYKEESSNSYDNTILYTDHVLSEIINELKPYKAMFIYISDHGESLGENGIYLHSYEYSKAPKEQLHVPYLLWFSDNLLNSDPLIKRKLEIAKENANKKVDQSTVLYSLLDCINVQSNFIDKEKSICSKSLGHNTQFGRK